MIIWYETDEFNLLRASLGKIVIFAHFCYYYYSLQGLETIHVNPIHGQ